MSQHKEQQGFLTFAQNTDQVDYLQLAYLQALNVKATQVQNRFAVIVDKQTAARVTDRHRQVFDYVIELDNPAALPFANEPAAFTLTPFKETVKLESDLLFTRSIDHWWTAFRIRDVYLPTAARTYLDSVGTVRRYRESFDQNHLPNVYNGLMYFRYSQCARQFFQTTSRIFNNWELFRTQLKSVDGPPTTDVVYALAALMVGSDQVTMPSMDFLNFVHMKSGFNGWSDTRTWTETVMNERDGDIIRINNINQLNPVHYHDKTYATQELIEYYEQRILVSS